MILVSSLYHLCLFLEFVVVELGGLGAGTVIVQEFRGGFPVGFWEQQAQDPGDERVDRHDDVRERGSDAVLQHRLSDHLFDDETPCYLTPPPPGMLRHGSNVLTPYLLFSECLL